PDDDHLVAYRIGAQPVAAPIRDHGSVPGRGELVAVEKNRARPRGDDNPSARPDHAHEAFVPREQRRVDVGRAGPTQGRHVTAPARKVVIHPGVEAVAEADVEKDPEGRENHRHHPREHQRQPNADREAAHAPSLRRRYPAPRTVSSDRRPYGRSIFSRRYRTYTSTTFERVSYA